MNFFSVSLYTFNFNFLYGFTHTHINSLSLTVRVFLSFLPFVFFFFFYSFLLLPLFFFLPLPHFKFLFFLRLFSFDTLLLTTPTTHNVCSLLYFEFTTNWYYINKNILNTLCLRWVLVLSMIWFSLFSSNFCFVILFVLQNEITYYHQTYTHTHSA